jgi:aminoglycoside 3-N-acetyltransferase
VVTAITKNGLSNKIVCLHSSIRSFGGLENGPQTIIEAFLKEDCTLVVPTFSWDYLVPPLDNQKPKQNAWDYINDEIENGNKIYDIAALDIDEDMGILPAAIVNTNGRIRGNHPLCSFSAIGRKAGVIIGGQDPLDVFYPLEKLANENGYIILMGVDYNAMTLIHLAEKKAGRNPFRRWAKNGQGDTIMVEVGGCSEGFTNLSTYFKEKGIVKEQIVGKSVWKIINAREALLLTMDLIMKNPEITECKEKCLRCQEAIKGGPLL